MEAPLALYRRYRPQTFAEVIGQAHVTEPLQQALRNNRVNHAYLFSGPRGCGKTTSARILARCLNCEVGPTPEPCGKCQSCLDLARGGPGSIDVIEIDAASHGGVDDARDLRERAFFSPVSSRFKIYIVDEAHMVTTQGFNALLKLVEEPPEHLKFIFATTEPEKVIGTIRSRTHHYPFRLVPPKVLQDYLADLCDREGVSVDAAALPLVVRAGGGSVRDTLSVLDQLMGGAGEEGVTYARAVGLLGYTHESLLDEVIDALAAGDGGSVFTVVDKVIESGQDPRRFAEDLLRRLRDLVIMSAVPDAAGRGLLEGPPDQAERLSAQAARFGTAELTRAADLVNAGLTEMRGATAPRLHLELICARILLPGVDDSEQGLYARLDRLERRLSIAGGTVPATGAGEGLRPVADAGPAETARPRAPQPERRESPRGGATGDERAPRPRVPAEGAGEPAAARSQPDAEPPAAPSTGESAQEESETTRPAAPAAGAAAGSAPGQAGEDLGDSSAAASASSPSPAESAAADWGTPLADRGSQAPAASRSGGAPASEPAAAPAASTPPASTPPASTLPTSTPPASAPGDMGIADVRRLWPDVLEAVKGRRRFSWVMLSQNAQLAALHGGTLTVALVNAGARDSFTRSGSDELLRQALREVLGVDWRIESIVDPTAGGGAPGGSGGSSGGGGHGSSGGGSHGGNGGGTTGGGPPSGGSGDFADRSTDHGSRSASSGGGGAAGSSDGVHGPAARGGATSDGSSVGSGLATSAATDWASAGPGEQDVPAPSGPGWQPPADDVDGNDAGGDDAGGDDGGGDTEAPSVTLARGAAAARASIANGTVERSGDHSANSSEGWSDVTPATPGGPDNDQTRPSGRARAAAAAAAAAGRPAEPEHDPDKDVDPDTDGSLADSPTSHAELLRREFGAELIEELPAN
ncbi:DNA polymerase III subunit gamma and tau [Actinopolymorpha pittospori]|uniref:DNA polymerase III subunit gamma/tau n=1 Tax=Actinopolymorpha pittospori TaxID=648752 RepID=A0A927RIK4_9ACTN|nr:DNA polymerase-3 subunit gamma/tau [Actinopolymorpha pittospori]